MNTSQAQGGSQKAQAKWEPCIRMESAPGGLGHGSQGGFNGDDQALALRQLQHPERAA